MKMSLWQRRQLLSRVEFCAAAIRADLPQMMNQSRMTYLLFFHGSYLYGACLLCLHPICEINPHISHICVIKRKLTYFISIRFRNEQTEPTYPPWPWDPPGDTISHNWGLLVLQQDLVLAVHCGKDTCRYARPPWGHPCRKYSTWWRWHWESQKTEGLRQDAWPLQEDHVVQKLHGRRTETQTVRWTAV